MRGGSLLWPGVPLALAAAILFGAATPAASGALLLNLESLATMAIAWLASRENVDRRHLHTHDDHHRHPHS